jgi:hypothetical protein
MDCSEIPLGANSLNNLDNSKDVVFMQHQMIVGASEHITHENRYITCMIERQGRACPVPAHTQVGRRVIVT